MEEDIKVLEKIVQEIIYEDNCNTFANTAPFDIAKAIENLIKRNKELEAINFCTEEIKRYNKKHFIDKDKIKEKIKYYEELIKTNPEDEEILRHVMQALNEILEESEE